MNSAQCNKIGYSSFGFGREGLRQRPEAEQLNTGYIYQSICVINM